MRAYDILRFDTWNHIEKYLENRRHQKHFDYSLDIGHKLNAHKVFQDVFWTSKVSSIYALCLGCRLVCYFLRDRDNFNNSISEGTWRVKIHYFPGNIYLYKANNRSTRKKCEMCSKLTIKTPERLHWIIDIVDLFFENEFDDLVEDTKNNTFWL